MDEQKLEHESVVPESEKMSKKEKAALAVGAAASIPLGIMGFLAFCIPIGIIVLIWIICIDGCQAFLK